MLMFDPLSRAYLSEPPTETEYCNELEESARGGFLHFRSTTEGI